jgi:hypothetical protein
MLITDVCSIQSRICAVYFLCAHTFSWGAQKQGHHSLLKNLRHYIVVTLYWQSWVESVKEELFPPSVSEQVPFTPWTACRGLSVKAEQVCSRDPKRLVLESETSWSGQFTQVSRMGLVRQSSGQGSLGYQGCFLTDVFKDGSGTVPWGYAKQWGVSQGKKKWGQGKVGAVGRFAWHCVLW